MSKILSVTEIYWNEISKMIKEQRVINKNLHLRRIRLHFKLNQLLKTSIKHKHLNVTF